MILDLFRRKSSQALVDGVYDAIVAAARRPALFAPPYGVADTVEGRFEILTLHAFLVLRRLSALPPPAPDFAQDLADRIFRGFDSALREMGVGDLTVPKRMKRLAGDFGGRNGIYAKALTGEEPLDAALARNVLGTDDTAAAAALAAWVRGAAARLERLDLADIERAVGLFEPLEAL